MINSNDPELALKERGLNDIAEESFLVSMLMFFYGGDPFFIANF